MTITVTPTVDAGSTPPRVLLSVSATAGETAATVTRLNPDGTTAPVRTSDGNPLPLAAGNAALYDYEASYGAPVAYSTAESPGVVSGQVVVAASRVWLVHPGVPGLSMPIRLGAGALAQRTRAATRGVFTPMGRENAVVITDGARKSVQSSLVVLTATSAELDALEALVADSGVLLLNIPATLGYNFRTCYVSLGDMQEQPVAPKMPEPWVTSTYPLVVVDRPSGGSQSQRTYVDVLAAFSTYSAVQSAYPSYTALLSGP